VGARGLMPEIIFGFILSKTVDLYRNKVRNSEVAKYNDLSIYDIGRMTCII